MQVYRFEHREHGYGPLCGRSSFPWDFYFHNHMTPINDMGFNSFLNRVKSRDRIESYLDHPNFFFGASDLDWLLGLLKDEASFSLENHGFELMVYEVTEDYYVLLDGQVCFNKNKAVRIQ